MNRTKRLTGACTQCGGPIEFHAEMIGTLAQCPLCRKQTELLLAAPPAEPLIPRKVLIWTVITCVLLVLGAVAVVVGLKRFEKLAASRKDRAVAAASGRATEAAALAGFEVSAISLEKGEGSSGNYAVGTVVNSSNRQRLGVTVELDLLDAGGQQVRIGRGYRPVLEAGARWEFKVPAGDAKAVSARLALIKEAQ